MVNNSVSVDKCLNYVNNKFELVLISAKRARNIAIKNEKPMVGSLSDKPTVIALMEIEQGYNLDLYNKDHI